MSPSAVNQPVEVASHETNGAQAGQFTIAEQPLHEPRRLRVVAVGAGLSGLTLAYKFKHESNISRCADLCIYEKNADVGGTWFENRYPGISCDIPAHAYAFLFEPNPDWSAFYVNGQEIFEYIRRTTTKYGLDENIKFNSRVVETIWNDATGKWDIKIDNNGTIITDSADVLINGSGLLNKWKWPQIPGLHDFQGDLVHSAVWDQKLDWKDKSVAVLGNGSSGIQILPQIQKTAKHVSHFIRGPTWISGGLMGHLTKDGQGTNFQYSEEERANFRNNPAEFREYRRNVEHEANKFFQVIQRDGPIHPIMSGMIKTQMEQRLKNDPELCEKLIPKWEVACRRITPGDGYLEALQADNVKVHMGEIQSVTPKGIKTADGQEIDLDIIICATGFDVSFTPFWKLIGRNGISLADQWKEKPEAYFSVCAANMPNYFIYQGPNCPVGHGSLIGAMDTATDWMIRWIDKIATEDIKSITVKSGAVQDFNIYTQELLKRTVWSGGCRSWYKNGETGTEARITAMYPGSVLHIIDIFKSFRAEDFDFEYRSANRFRFLGNGMTQKELDDGDLGYYVK